MMDWLGRAFGLPSDFDFEASKGKGGGCILGSASDSIFCAILAARHHAMKKMGCYPSDNSRPLIHPGAALQKLVCYTSCETHSSTPKGANVALVDIVILRPNDEFKITGPILEEAIKKDLANGRVPFLFIGSIGSTGGVCFDDMLSCGPVAKKYGMWIHIDAAYAGNAFLLPEMHHLKHGLEYVDTIEINPYKCLDVAYELSCLWVRDLETYKEPFTIDATYLIDEFESEDDRELRINSVDFRHYGIPLTRRLRALKLWFLFRTYGMTGLRDNVRTKIRLSKYLEKLVLADPRFDVVNIVELGVVCIRQRPNDETHRAWAMNPPKEGQNSYLDEQNMNLLHRCNSSRKIHLVPTTLRGIYCIRFAITYVFATEEDILRAWRVVQENYVNKLDIEIENTLHPEKATGETKILPYSSFIRMVPETFYNSKK